MTMTMQGSYVEIIRADGRVHRHPLERDRITIGREVGAVLVLEDAPELEPMHLLLAPRDDGCWVSVARAARTPTRQAGASFENGLVPWGAELDVGAVTFRLARAEARAGRRRRLAGPLRKAALIVACLWIAARVLGDPPAGPPRSQVPAPALFDDREAAACPGDADAGARAREAAEAAHAKAERYPFSPHDGVAAVTLWAAAAACAAAAGDVDGAAAARAERDRLRARVEDDYRAHRLALERALDHRHYAVALDQARLVADLLRDRDGEYQRWLVRLDRSLVEKVARERKRR
jgi:hypothetical protein